MNTNIKSNNNVLKNGKGLFVKRFNTSRNYYIYDVYSNEIIKAKRIIFYIVGQFHMSIDQIYDNLKGKYSKTDVLNAYKEVRNSIKSGIFNSIHPKIYDIKESESEVIYYFENVGLKQLILDLTNQCNLRCKYCVYSGKYQYERIHQNRNMSKNCAKKAVDYFLKNRLKKGKSSITFYGGEPFLKFELLKYIVDYAKSKINNIEFSLTTNGTLINDEIILYLVENDISLNVSLDGPKRIHDKNRIMINGDGSFDLIMKNLERIKRIAPDYFTEKISYRSINTPPYNSDEIIDFFYNSEIFIPLRNPVTISSVATYRTSFIKESDKHTAISQYNKNVKRAFNRYKKALISDKYDKLNVEKEWFKDLISSIHFRNRFPLNKRFPALGQCIPGMHRLFVNPNGKFYMCEKVGEHYCIGDVDKGLDFKTISNFYKQWVRFFKNCSHCWALRLCKKCFNDIHRNGRLDSYRRDEFCKSNLKQLEMLLSAYCEILEKNPNAFKNFNPIEYL